MSADSGWVGGAVPQFPLLCQLLVSFTRSLYYRQSQTNYIGENWTLRASRDNLIEIELEVHGRAKREAARRLKSECKVNLGNRNSSRTNGS